MVFSGLLPGLLWMNSFDRGFSMVFCGCLWFLAGF